MGFRKCRFLLTLVGEAPQDRMGVWAFHMVTQHHQPTDGARWGVGVCSPPPGLGALHWGSMASPSPQPVSASAAHVLGEVCREKQEAAIPLVRFFLHYGRVVPFISAIADAEVQRTQ